MTSSRYRKSFEVAGYTFQAELLCPGCTLEAVKVAYPLDYPLSSTIQDGDTSEDVLRTVAKSRNLAGAGIDLADALSFDSDDFPKVVFVDQLDDEEHCGSCGGEL